MCGEMTSRSSRGGLIAAMSPETKTSSEFVLSFNNPDTSGHTHATLSAPNYHTMHALQEAVRFIMRIEKYGDLESTGDIEKIKPLYSFELNPHRDEMGKIKFNLPYKLDFGVSDSGIVGRQATLLSSSDNMSRMNVIGKGIIGWN